ncbi:MAG: hypothetical protein NZ889_00100 [Candidatus Pacearchaeota archaeon]|nr:hypothetical protein [Candidatus Pacearchaeota archaeon]
MPRINKEKERKIQESILQLLFQNSPKLLFTSQIAKELARDEEYIKKLLLDLESKELVTCVKKNNTGKQYSRRLRWRLSNKTYEVYKNLMRPFEHERQDQRSF